MQASWAFDRAAPASAALLALVQRCSRQADEERRRAVTEALESVPSLSMFATAERIERAVAELLFDRSARETLTAETDAPSNPASTQAAIESFVVLGARVARADGAWSDAETRVISKAIDALFSPVSAVVHSDDSIDTDAASVGAAVKTLLHALSWDARSVAFDWLCRVAIADEQLHEEESTVLLSIGEQLGFSFDDVRQHIEWAADRDPNASLRLPNGSITCANCGSVMPAGSTFCGDCGATIGVRALDEERVESNDQCETCGASNSSEARFCGACGGKLRDARSAALSSSDGPDYGTGQDAEEFVLELLKTHWDSTVVEYSLHERDGIGETDIVMRRSDISNADRAVTELHIEVKHVATNSNTVFWTVGEVKKAQHLRGEGVTYLMVIVRDVRGENPSVNWLEDPLEDLRVDGRAVIGSVKSHAISAGEPWDVEPSWPPTTHRPEKFEIPVGDVLQRLAWGSDNVAPVRAWFNRVSTSSIERNRRG